MEIDEIKDYWKKESMHISENVKVNKNASFEKLRSSFDRVRIKRLLRLVLMCVVVPLFFALFVFPLLKNDGSGLYYLALALFIVSILFFFATYIYYYICLLKIDFAKSIVKAQKEILRLEMFEKKLTVLGIIIVPIVTLSIFKIFAIPFKQETIIFIVLTVLVMIVGYIVRTRILIPNEYNKIKSYMNEIKEDEES